MILLNKRPRLGLCNKAWFDYIMGTRVVSSLDLKEQNPLGITLPKPVAKWLSKTVELYFPAKILDAEKVKILETEVQVDSRIDALS